MNEAVLVALILGGVVVGLLLHEGTHFAIGYWMGTVREAGVILRNEESRLRKIPTGLYVGHSKRNYWSTFGPFVWIVPHAAIELSYRLGYVDAVLSGVVIVPLFVAWGGVLVSDVPYFLGLIDRHDEWRFLPLIVIDGGVER